MLAVCNEGCNKQFELTELKELKHDNDIIETYFKCPKCGKEYICFYTDKDIRKLQAELSNKWGKSSRKEIEELQVKVKNKMNTLKSKMLSTH